LVVTRAKTLYPAIKSYFVNAGFYNVNITGLESDALLNKIGELNPALLIIDSDFNQGATPFNVGEIHNSFPDLHIAAVAVNNFPLAQAAWFIWYGAKSCLHLWADGMEEFKRGLQTIRSGKEYISPVIQSILNLIPEWPKTKGYITKKQLECLILLCSGMKVENIANEMYITRRTVDNVLEAIFKTFNVNSKEELMSMAWKSGLVNRDDLRFYRRDNEIKIPEWAKNKQQINEKLKGIFASVYGN